MYDTTAMYGIDNCVFICVWFVISVCFHAGLINKCHLFFSQPHLICFLALCVSCIFLLHLHRLVNLLHLKITSVSGISDLSFHDLSLSFPCIKMYMSLLPLLLDPPKSLLLLICFDISPFHIQSTNLYKLITSLLHKCVVENLLVCNTTNLNLSLSHVLPQPSPLPLFSVPLLSLDGHFPIHPIICTSAPHQFSTTFKNTVS